MVCGKISLQSIRWWNSPSMSQFHPVSHTFSFPCCAGEIQLIQEEKSELIGPVLSNSSTMWQMFLSYEWSIRFIRYTTILDHTSTKIWNRFALSLSILCNKERFEDVVLWSRSKVIAVPRALQNMIAWQSSTAAFTVDISKHLQINQITTPEIFHLDFQQERECLMRLTCVGLPKWTFYVYAARCRQMPPGAPWKTAAPGRSSRRLGGCCSCASGTSAITGTSALWHSGSWLLIDSAVQLGRFRRNLWDFDCLRIIGWNMQRTSEDMP